MRPVLALTLMALTASLAACHALDRDRYHRLLEASASGDGDAGAGACTPNTDGGTVGDGCTLYHAPDRTPGAMDLGPDSGVHVFAMRNVTFGFTDSVARATVGLDRDSVCTRATVGSPQGCNPIGNTLSNPVPPVEDGLGGRDDALATVLGAYFGTAQWNESMLNLYLAQGARTLGVRISSLGGPDDAQVNVEWFPILNGHASDGTSAPRWDGTDIWAIDGRLAYDPVQPGVALIHSNVGYTSCGMLVAHLPSRMPMRFSSNARTIRLTLSNAVMMGPIDDAGHHFGPIDFAGVWNIPDALGDLATLNVCPATTGPEAVLWNTAVAVIHSAADVLSTGENSPATECDAISAAFRAELVEITLGPDSTSTVIDEHMCP